MMKTLFFLVSVAATASSFVQVPQVPGGLVRPNYCMPCSPYLVMLEGYFKRAKVMAEGCPHQEIMDQMTWETFCEIRECWLERCGNSYDISSWWEILQECGNTAYNEISEPFKQCMELREGAKTELCGMYDATTQAGSGAMEVCTEAVYKECKEHIPTVKDKFNRAYEEIAPIAQKYAEEIIELWNNFRCN